MIFRILFVIITAVLISVLAAVLGNHVKKMVENAENRIDEAETGLINGDPPPVLGHFNTDAQGDMTEVLAIGADPSEEEPVPHADKLKEQFDTLSVNVTKDGKLIYTSPALLELARVSEDHPLWSEAVGESERIRTFCSLWKEEGFRLSAVMEASCGSGELWSENDRVLIRELAGLGFDEVVVTGVGELTSKTIQYLSRLAMGEISVGVVLPAESYFGTENEKNIRLLAASGVFLCADLNGDSIPIEETEGRVKTLCAKLRSSVDAHGVRIFIDSPDEAYAFEEYDVLSAGKIGNIQIAVSGLSFEKLLNQDEGEETDACEEAETEILTNPYAVTGTTESETAEESPSIWY